MLNPAVPAPAAPPSSAATSGEALPAGTRLGEFELLRVLGSGGFGIVYLAHDHALDRAVAIKEYLPEPLARRVGRLQVAVRSAAHADSYAAGLKSFVGEARILARFNHPAMVKVYRYWEANGTGYMVMPHVQGPTLREWRRSLAAAPTEGTLRAIVDPLLDALTLLHAEGIYHRDLAPDNVLLPAEGQPVLLDFGAARRVIGDHTRALTAMLKPSFAPIEQYGEAAQLRQGPWTDLYALGAAIVYLLDAAPPPPATVRALHDDMPAHAERSLPGVSRCFLAAVDWALAVRPQDRPQSVQEFRNALDGRLEPPPRRGGADGGAQLHVLPAAPAAPPMAATAAAPPSEPAMAHAHARTVAEPRAAAWHTQDGALPHGAAPAADLPLPPAGMLAAPPTPMPAPAGAAAAVSDAERSRSMKLGAVGLLVAGVLVMAALWSRNATVPGTSELPPRGRGGAQLEGSATAASPRAAARHADARTPRTPQPALRTAQAPRPAGGALESEAATATPVRDGAASPAAGSPAEACAERENVFSRSWCIGMRCNEPRFAEHPQCVQLRRDQQRDRGPGLP